MSDFDAKEKRFEQDIEDGYDTEYLWESVRCKDRLLEILQKYMHLQHEYDTVSVKNLGRYRNGLILQTQLSQQILPNKA